MPIEDVRSSGGGGGGGTSSSSIDVTFAKENSVMSSIDVTFIIIYWYY